jgi:hypothetical protein
MYINNVTYLACLHVTEFCSACVFLCVFALTHTHYQSEWKIRITQFKFTTLDKQCVYLYKSLPSQVLFFSQFT